MIRLTFLPRTDWELTDSSLIRTTFVKLEEVHTREMTTAWAMRGLLKISFLATMVRQA
jgi:hypothetical protein